MYVYVYIYIPPPNVWDQVAHVCPSLLNALTRYFLRRAFSYVATIQLIMSWNFTLSQHLIRSPFSNLSAFPITSFIAILFWVQGPVWFQILCFVVSSLWFPLIRNNFSAFVCVSWPWHSLKVHGSRIIEWASVWTVQSVLRIRFRLCIFQGKTTEVMLCPFQCSALYQEDHVSLCPYGWWQLWSLG